MIPIHYITNFYFPQGKVACISSWWSFGCVNNVNNNTLYYRDKRNKRNISVNTLQACLLRKYDTLLCVYSWQYSLYYSHSLPSLTIAYAFNVICIVVWHIMYIPFIILLHWELVCNILYPIGVMWSSVLMIFDLVKPVFINPYVQYVLSVYINVITYCMHACHVVYTCHV